jgi:hypothetical protein
MNHHFDGIADAQQLWIDRQGEFAKREDAFGFAADVDEHFVLVFLNDRPAKHLAFVEDFERFFVQALLERELILFVVNRGYFSCRDKTFPLSFVIIYR